MDKYELTEEEKTATIEAALKEARRVKMAKIKSEEYWQKVKAADTLTYYNSDQLFELVKVNYAGKGFIIDKWNEELIKNLCKYFTGDASGPFDLKKGLMLRGGVGTEKTSLMRLFQSNQTNPYQILTCKSISYQYADEEIGSKAIILHSNLIRSQNLKLSYGQEYIGTCYDDFGEEDDKKHFGNEVNVMADIIFNRYDKHEVTRGKTHITTNLSMVEIEQRYGTRVKSRLVEMVNDIVFHADHPDRRK